MQNKMKNGVSAALVLAAAAGVASAQGAGGFFTSGSNLMIEADQTASFTFSPSATQFTEPFTGSFDGTPGGTMNIAGRIRGGGFFGPYETDELVLEFVLTTPPGSLLQVSVADLVEDVAGTPTTWVTTQLETQDVLFVAPFFFQPTGNVFLGRGGNGVLPGELGTGGPFGDTTTTYYTILDPFTGGTAGIGGAVGDVEGNIVWDLLLPTVCGPEENGTAGTGTLGVDEVLGSLSLGGSIQDIDGDTSLPGFENEICAYTPAPDDPDGAADDAIFGFVFASGQDVPFDGPEAIVQFDVLADGVLTYENDFHDDPTNAGAGGQGRPGSFILMSSDATVTGFDLLGNGSLLGEASDAAIAFTQNAFEPGQFDFDGDGVLDAESFEAIVAGTYFLSIESALDPAFTGDEDDTFVNRPGEYSIELYLHDPLACGGSFADVGELSVNVEFPVGVVPANLFDSADTIALEGVDLTGDEILFGGSSLGIPTENEICSYADEDGAFDAGDQDDPGYEFNDVQVSFTIDQDAVVTLAELTPADVDYDYYIFDGSTVATGVDVFGDGSQFGSQVQTVLGAFDEGGTVLLPAGDYIVSADPRSGNGIVEFSLAFASVTIQEANVPPPGSADIDLDLGPIADESSVFDLQGCVSAAAADTFFALFDEDGDVVAADEDGCGAADSLSNLDLLSLPAGRYVMAIGEGGSDADDGFTIQDNLGSSFAVSGTIDFLARGDTSLVGSPEAFTFSAAADEFFFVEFEVLAVDRPELQFEPFNLVSGSPSIFEIPTIDPLTGESAVTTFDLCGSDIDFDAEIGVFDADGDFITFEDNDDVCVGLHPSVGITGVDPDEVLVIAIAGFDSRFDDGFQVRNDVSNDVAEGTFPYEGGNYVLSVNGIEVANGTVPAGGVVYYEFIGEPEDTNVPCNAADLAQTNGLFGNLDGADIAAFVSAFVSADPSADVDGDGSVNGSDIAAFVSAFVTGCP